MTTLDEKMNGEKLLTDMEPAYYAPSDSMEYKDADGYYYTANGQQLRDPSEYDTYSEGYTPFGDE